ncbi:MAG: zincin-like metallopeptidase domain-containing protein [Tepidisphaeraceae bacterium]|jgi:antirestriction protein ArdC
MSSFDLYQTVTDQIVAMLEASVVPWRSPILGGSSAGHPKNLNTGKPYRGVNVFLLAFTAFAKGYGSSYWLTFNQAKDRGGSVKKGEKSSMVVFYKQYETTDKATGEPTTVPVLRYYNVFNAEQVDSIEIPDAVKFEPLDFKPIESAERIAGNFAGGPAVQHDGGQQAFYRPASDTVHLPERTRFASVEEYYSTLFHELSHSTGHSSRLDRKLDTNPRPFGSPDYGKEELVAEMSAAFLCSHAGIQPTVIGNQAAYLAGWLRQLKSDKKLVVSAAGQAQRSADWIRGERGERE